MEVEEEEEGAGEFEEGGDVTQRALRSLEFLIQDAESSGTTLVDAHNGLNKLRRFPILWTVQHRWWSGATFAFNCYMHWEKLLLHQLGEPPATGTRQRRLVVIFNCDQSLMPA